MRTPTGDFASRMDDLPGRTDDVGGPTDDGGAPTDDGGAPTDDVGAPTDDGGAPTDDCRATMDWVLAGTAGTRALAEPAMCNDNAATVGALKDAAGRKQVDQAVETITAW